MRPEGLRDQVSGLLARGYAGTTFNRCVREETDLRTLSITFDDGERNVIEHGLSVLAALGVPGTVFVTVSAIGGPGSLGWEDLAALVRSGWEIGSHTLTHAVLPGLDDRSPDEELRGSRAALEERLTVPCCSISYPYGLADDRVRAAAAAAGFTAGCTTSGTLRGDALAWPRVGVDGYDGQLLFRVKTGRLGRALRATPLASPLELVGRRIRPHG